MSFPKTNTTTVANLESLAPGEDWLIGHQFMENPSIHTHCLHNIPLLIKIDSLTAQSGSGSHLYLYLPALPLLTPARYRPQEAATTPPHTRIRARLLSKLLQLFFYLFLHPIPYTHRSFRLQPLRIQRQPPRHHSRFTSPASFYNPTHSPPGKSAELFATRLPRYSLSRHENERDGAHQDTRNSFPTAASETISFTL